MTDTWTEAEKDAYFNPDGVESESWETPPDDDMPRDYDTIFDAPDYATFVKKEQTQRSKEYERKIASMLKMIALHSFSTGNVADGATVLHYGPKFAKSAGDLTDVSDGAARAIDLMTAPDNPWVAFALLAIPFGLQFIRNHESEAEQVRKTWKQARAERKRAKREGLTPPKRQGVPLTIRGPFGKKLTFRLPVPRPSVIAGVFRHQTHDPGDLAAYVLSDEKLVRALQKQGIRVTVRREPDA